MIDVIFIHEVTVCGSGLKDYRVQDSHLTASSQHPNSDCKPEFARLYYPKMAWLSVKDG